MYLVRKTAGRMSYGAPLIGVIMTTLSCHFSKLERRLGACSYEHVSSSMLITQVRLDLQEYAALSRQPTSVWRFASNT